MKKKNSNIFISYSHDDEFAAKELWQNLSEFLSIPDRDELNIAPGDRWQDKLHESLDKAKAVVFLISQNSVRNPWVLFELGAAQEMCKTIIPVLIGSKGVEKELPESLQGISYIDAREHGFQKAASEVAHALSKE